MGDPCNLLTLKKRELNSFSLRLQITRITHFLQRITDRITRITHAVCTRGAEASSVSEGVMHRVPHGVDWPWRLCAVLPCFVHLSFHWHVRNASAQAPSASLPVPPCSQRPVPWPSCCSCTSVVAWSGSNHPPAHAVLPPAAFAALADEAWSEVTALSEDSRRKHVHWVHVRTQNPEHQQPDSFTREGFWQHLCRVYKDTYPRPENPSGSILLFGVVAKERHAGSMHAAERAEHHHAPCYCSVQHYWKPVAQRSLTLGVKLHAACHDGYSIMYTYVRCPSPRKPLPELDPDLWYSDAHPRGRLLQDLLDVGLQAVRRFHSRGSSSRPGQDSPRFRATDVFAFVRETGIRSLHEFRLRAHASAAVGDARVAEFCTVHTDEELQRYLDGAWAVHDAPQHGLPTSADRVGKLHAAGAWPCTCGGIWVPGITFVLQNNAEDIPQFCSDVLRALALGACRGANLAIIGPPGCGKITVFEGLDLVFAVCGKPERDNTFPLAGILDAEVLLWQEFTWDPKLCAFEDLLSLTAGERFGIREAHKKPRQFRNTSPMFYTAWAPLQYRGRAADQVQVYNDAMAERFTTRRWTRPLPRENRLPKFPQCARCMSTFLLSGGSPDDV